MTKYSYAKYKSYRGVSFGSGGSGSTSSSITALYDSYSYNAETDLFTISTLVKMNSYQVPLNKTYYEIKYYAYDSRRTEPTLSGAEIQRVKYYQYDGTWLAYYVDNAFYTYYRGTFVGNVTAEDGTYPVNGRHSDGFWYVRGAVVSPEMFVNVDGVWRSSDEQFVNIDGVWRVVDEAYTNVDGIWRKL